MWAAFSVTVSVIYTCLNTWGHITPVWHWMPACLVCVLSAALPLPFLTSSVQPFPLSKSKCSLPGLYTNQWTTREQSFMARHTIFCISQNAKHSGKTNILCILCIQASYFLEGKKFYNFSIPFPRTIFVTFHTDWQQMPILKSIHIYHKQPWITWNTTITWLISTLLKVN